MIFFININLSSLLFLSKYSLALKKYPKKDRLDKATQAGGKNLIHSFLFL